MKFGAKLETFVVPEWADKYIRYKELSRLAKRASRINSGKIPGVDDDAERALLENMFVVQPEFPSRNIQVLYVKSNSEYQEQSKIDNPVQRHSNPPDLSSHPQCIVAIPEERETDSISSSESVDKRIKSTDQKSPLPDDVSVKSDILKAAVDQYEKNGHICRPDVDPCREAVEFLQSKLEQLDHLDPDSVADNGTVLATNGSFCSSQLSMDAVASRSYGGSIADTLDKIPSAIQSNETVTGKDEIMEYIRDRATRRTEKTNNGRYCFKFSIGGSQSTTCRFNLNKNTKMMDDESLCIFNKVLRDDIRVVLIHYVTEMEYIKSLVRFMKSDIAKRGGKLDDSYAGLIRKACTAFWDSCDKLRLYLNLNTLAVYKVLKKKDKLLGTSDVFNLFPVYKSILLSVETSQGVLEDVIQIYNSLMDQVVVDFGALKTDIESTLDSLRPKPAHGLFFVYGLCTVLLANSLFLCSFNFPLEFDLSILLSQIAPFRFFFAMSLIWWGFGWCQNYLETYGVNYQFQFNISSNYSATDKDYYEIGAGQTLTSLLLFMLFLLDCRLHVVPPHNIYFVYPLLLVVLHLFIVMWPNRNLKLKLRKRLLFAIIRVLGAPFGAGNKITLAESIIADVMTSLTRSLRDLVFMITYFIFGMTTMHQATLPIVKSWVVPTVMCYPYVLRFSQCLRRYINEKRWLHVGNMAKYLSAILCVVVSSISWVGYFGMEELHRRILVISFYVFSTLYQCWWDYVIDWGLDIGYDMFKTRQNRRMYRRQAYYCAVVFNMACRCTWALTTIPFPLLTHEELSSEVVSLLVTVIEIVRRVVWVTFRLESEHLLNSYKYRTALWVPKLYNCKNLIVKEMKMLNEQL
ncbi:hypothetical protein BaOVIS_024110 [Babesia ovis]|uniref:EXS family protein n=1 Tax=Babesia ovis TaxID=5869 RepID=A0A9W5TE62_BABOV|nr:hypothetical protein BaOVIS_024110 [Babesia ovis]